MLLTIIIYSFKCGISRIFKPVPSVPFSGPASEIHSGSWIHWLSSRPASVCPAVLWLLSLGPGKRMKKNKKEWTCYKNCCNCSISNCTWHSKFLLYKKNILLYSKKYFLLTYLKAFFCCYCQESEILLIYSCKFSTFIIVKNKIYFLDFCYIKEVHCSCYI